MSANTAPSRPTKILIVEDSPDARDLLRYAFEAKGFEVAEASNGADALCAAITAVKTTPFELYVVDIAMSYIDGISFIKALRCLESDEILPKASQVVVYTAFSKDFKNEHVLQKLDARCVSKPNLSTLLETVTQGGIDARTNLRLH